MLKTLETSFNKNFSVFRLQIAVHDTPLSRMRSYSPVPHADFRNLQLQIPAYYSTNMGKKQVQQKESDTATPRRLSDSRISHFRIKHAQQGRI